MASAPAAGRPNPSLRDAHDRWNRPLECIIWKRCTTPSGTNDADVHAGDHSMRGLSAEEMTGIREVVTGTVAKSWMPDTPLSHAMPSQLTPLPNYLVIDTTNNLAGLFRENPTLSDFDDVHLGLVMLINVTELTYYDRRTRQWSPIPSAYVESSEIRHPRHQPPFPAS